MSLLEGAWAGEQGSDVRSKGTGIGVGRGGFNEEEVKRLGGRGTASAFQTRAASPREVLRSGALCWDGGMSSCPKKDQWVLGQNQEAQMVETRMADK